MTLILFLSFDTVLHHVCPEYYICERLHEEGFDLDRMILSGATLDGDRLWYAQQGRWNGSL